MQGLLGRVTLARGSYEKIWRRKNKLHFKEHAGTRH